MAGQTLTAQIAACVARVDALANEVARDSRRIAALEAAAKREPARTAKVAEPVREVKKAKKARKLHGVEHTEFLAAKNRSVKGLAYHSGWCVGC